MTVHNTAKLAITRQLPGPLQQAIGQLGELSSLDIDTGEPNIAAIDGATVLVSVFMDPLNAELIEQLPDSIRLIANIGVGTDHIDLQAAARRGLQVSNTPVVTEDTADLCMALILATCRKMSMAERLLRTGDWSSAQQQLATRVSGKTLAIVGFGAIGQAVARRARGFDMQIIYHGPNRKADAEQAFQATYYSDLKAMLATADIVSLNCPLNDSTRHIINADSLAAIKPGAMLINTGRGPLVHESALVDALSSEHLGGAGLDVYEFEPQVTSALLDFDSVTLLPHIGSATSECRTDMAMRVIGNISQFLSTGSPLDPVV